MPHGAPKLLNVSTLSRKNCLGHLLFHPLFIVSWVVFVVAACVSAIVQVSFSGPAVVSNAGGAAVTSSSATSNVAEGARIKPVGAKPASHAGAPQRLSPLNILISSLAGGYVPWALYWGIPPWAWLIAKSYQRASKALVGGIGCITFVTVGWWSALILLIVVVIYALFGGGIFHFLRRWWLLCHPKDVSIETPQLTPALSTASPPSSQRLDDLESQLRKLDDLYWNGLITRDEYESRRKRILKETL